MMRNGLTLALLLAGCLSRTEVGAEPGREVVDAGAVTLPDASLGPDVVVQLSAEELATRAFEQLLVGHWQGRQLGTILDVELTFQAENTYCLGAPPCVDPGRYFITDRIAIDRFAGVLQDGNGVRVADIDDAWIERIEGAETLRFTWSQDAVVYGEVELTRVD